MRARLSCRPAGVTFGGELLEPIDISLGGMRIRSHEDHPVGTVLRFDAFFPDVAPVRIAAEVRWTKALDENARALFDVGVAFAKVHPNVLNLVQACLGSDPSEATSEPVRAPVQSSVQFTPAQPVSDVRPTVQQPVAGRQHSDIHPILSAIPVVADGQPDRGARLDGRGGYLLWLIDGFITVETILDLSGMPAEETLALLYELLERGIVKLRSSALGTPAAQAAWERAEALDRVPVIVRLPEQARGVGIDRTGAVLSLVDGHTTVESIVDACYLPRPEVLRILHDLVHCGVLAFK